jgi:hypothetical protein
MSKGRIMRAVALVIVISMCMTLLTGCSQKEMNLIKALFDAKPIYSYEATSSVEFTLDIVPNAKRPASYLNDSLDTVYRMLSACLNGAKIDMSVKASSDKDYENIKEEIIITPSLFGGRMKDLTVGMWADFQSGDMDKSNIYFKMPKILSALSKETAGKDYLTMNFGGIMDLVEEESDIDFSNVFNFKELAGDSAGLMKPIADVIIKAASQMKPDEIYVNSVRQVVGEYGKMGRVYTLKISDRGFKKLLRSAIKDIDKKTAKEFVFAVLDASTEYLGNFATVSDIYEDMLDEIESLRLVLEEGFDKGYKDVIEAIGEFLDLIEKVRIIGPQGITFDIGVDYYGNIYLWDGIMDFSIDVEKIDQIMDNYYPSDVSKVNFSIKIYQKVTKINQVVNIEMPEITKANSISFEDFLAAQMTSYSNYYDDFDYYDYDEYFDDDGIYDDYEAWDYEQLKLRAAKVASGLLELRAAGV